MAFLLSLTVPHLSFLFFGFICGVSFVIICSPSLIPFLWVHMWRFFCHYLFPISHSFSLVSYVRFFCHYLFPISHSFSLDSYVAFLLSLFVPHLSFLFFGFICGVSFVIICSPSLIPFLWVHMCVSFVIICSPSLIPFLWFHMCVSFVIICSSSSFLFFWLYMWRFFCHYLFLISHFFSLVSYVKFLLSLFVPHLSFLFFCFICEVSFVIICSISLILCFMIVAFPMYLILHFIV